LLLQELAQLGAAFDGLMAGAIAQCVEDGGGGLDAEVAREQSGFELVEKILESRIAIIDGAMGTTIRTYGMKEADIRGERFKDSKKDLLNNGDLFSLTQPEMIGDIHRRFLEAGADIIETNTFGATSITQSEFFVDDPREHGGRKDPAFYQKIIDDPFLGDLAWEINEQSARQCREWADRVANETGRQRFVAGAIGPLTVSLSNSPDADDAGFRVVTFDQVKTPTRSRCARSSPAASTCCWWRRSSTR
jgi:5-methyltetrahydrofolate--homocysteine methyltransferase